MSRIQIFKNDGTFIKSFGTQGNGRRQFNYPFNIALDHDGNIIVSEWNNYRIQIVSQDRSVVNMFGTRGSTNGQFDNPWGVSVDKEGNIYIADCGNRRIQKFSNAGMEHTDIFLLKNTRNPHCFFYFFNKRISTWSDCYIR